MLALIPARGGSKGVPRKNIRIMAGHPLIAYTIAAAKKAKHIDRIIVSTEDEEIAEIARKYGAEVPFMRPEELAGDHAKVIDTMIYTIDRLNETSTAPIRDFILLQPTSPLRTPDDIDKAIELFYDRKADAVGSFIKTDLHYTRFRKIAEDGMTIDCFPGTDFLLNRQEKVPLYINNGAIAIYNYEVLKTKYSYNFDKPYAYVLDDERAVDIDTIRDFEYAEWLITKKNLNLEI